MDRQSQEDMPTDQSSRVQKAKENQDLAHEIVEKFTTCLTWREPYKNRWDRYYRLYRSDLNETNYPWQSNIFVPYSFSTIESLVPRLVSNRPEIDIVPREPKDEEHATVMKSLIDYQWDMMNMNVLMPEAVKEMCMYGTAILKVGWKTKTKMSTKKEMADEKMPELGMIENEEEETTYDAPFAELVDIYDFYGDPNGTTIESMAWCIHRTNRHRSYLKEMAEKKIYKNVNLVLDESNTSLNEDDQKQVRRDTVGISLPPQDPDLVELLEYWTEDRVIVVANRKYIIRDEKNPYKHGKKPFVYCVDQKVPHEFYGVGELEPIETLQYELNDRRNQRMDNITLALNRMWLVVNGKGVDEDELVSDAGGVIHASEVGAVTALDIPDVTSSSYQEETLIKGDIQQTSGVTDYTSGTGNDGSLGNDTATGISLLQEAGNARFRLKSQNIEDMLIKKLGELMVAMNEQFITDEQVLRIAGDDGVSFKKVQPEDIQGNYDVQVVAGSTMPSNAAVNIKQTMEMYQLFNGDPMVDQTELKKMVLKAINPKVNLEKLLPKQEPPQMAGQPGVPPGQGQPPGAPPQGAPGQPPQAEPPQPGQPGQTDQQGILQSALGGGQPHA